MGSNVCECPQPPGGEVSCGKDQIAICRVMDGVVCGFCMDVPEKFDDLSYFRALPFGKFIFDTLYQVTDEKRWQGPNASLRDALEIFKEGHYENSATGLEIQIKLPRQFYAESTDDELEEVEA